MIWIVTIVKYATQRRQLGQIWKSDNEFARKNEIEKVCMCDRERKREKERVNEYEKMNEWEKEREREGERWYFRFNINIYFLNKKRGKSVFSKRVQKRNEDTL